MRKKGERLIVLHTVDIDVEAITESLTRKGIPNLWIPKKESFFKIEAIPLLGTGKLGFKENQNGSPRIGPKGIWRDKCSIALFIQKIIIASRWPIIAEATVRLLILAHGFFNNKDVYLFKGISKELSEHYDVIAFDFRGHGKSSGAFFLDIKRKC